MRGSGRVFGAANALLASAALLTSGTLMAPASAQGAAAPAVWYRASAECPSGPEFLAKIADGSQRARLAQAGDHIDFVVTLLAGEHETVGRLERQTNGGTVAIRELRDATCSQVADALALSFGLALDPAHAASETPPLETAPSADATPEVETMPAAATTAPALTAPVLPPPAVARLAQPSDDRPAPPLGRRPAFGVDAGALTGLGTQTMLRGSAFVDLARLTRELSLRFAIVGALGSSPTPFGSVARWLLAGRGEVCPWRWGGQRLGLARCAAFELGTTSASVAGQSDNSLWAAPGVGLRASLAVVPTFRLEASAGVLIPLVRGQVFYGAAPLYQDEIIAFQAALGVSFGPR